MKHEILRKTTIWKFRHSDKFLNEIYNSSLLHIRAYIVNQIVNVGGAITYNCKSYHDWLSIIDDEIRFRYKTIKPKKKIEVILRGDMAQQFNDIQEQAELEDYWGDPFFYKYQKHII